MSCEPRFNYFEDCLPDSDPRAEKSLFCFDCNRMVHAGNNETMDAWFDTALGAICLHCFMKRFDAPYVSNMEEAFEQLAFKAKRVDKQ